MILLCFRLGVKYAFVIRIGINHFFLLLIIYPVKPHTARAYSIVKCEKLVSFGDVVERVFESGGAVSVILMG
jgi:hypothetical protein